jgi:hypothetical protein
MHKIYKPCKKKPDIILYNMYEKKLYAIHYYRICKVNTVGSEHKKCGQKYRLKRVRGRDQLVSWARVWFGNLNILGWELYNCYLIVFLFFGV